MTAICRRCGNLITAASDQAILAGLDYREGWVSKRTGLPIPASLYAAAHPLDSRKADFSRWFMTGPRDRRGFVPGPFSHEQVQRLARSGQIVPEFIGDDRVPHTYVLRKFGSHHV